MRFAPATKVHFFSKWCHAPLPSRSRPDSRSIKSGSCAAKPRLRMRRSNACTVRNRCSITTLRTASLCAPRSFAPIAVCLRIDLKGEDRADTTVIGYRAKKNSHVIDLSKVGYDVAADFWEPLYRHRQDSLLLEPEEFYILASKERIRVPPDYAAEMVAYEAACGEPAPIMPASSIRASATGRTGRLKGTQVVLEVRPHDVPFLIHDGQTFFKVVYDRMLDVPDRLYGVGLGSSYQQQALTLSKHFKV